MGESYIANWLINKNINIEHQKTFNWCVYKKKLRFDLYLPDYNTAIEYNGKQHFEYVEYFHKNIENFNKMKKRDAIKRKLAKDHEVTVIDINYNDNIEQKLISFIKNY